MKTLLFVSLSLLATGALADNHDQSAKTMDAAHASMNAKKEAGGKKMAGAMKKIKEVTKEEATKLCETEKAMDIAKCVVEKMKPMMKK